MHSIGVTRHFSNSFWKMAIATAFVLAAFATTAGAQSMGSSNSWRVVTTVEQAKTARLGRDVSLTGFVVEHLWRDYYSFRDHTGVIRVEIERHLWRGRRHNPKIKVRLTGDVSRDFRGRYVSVDRVRNVN